jgi:hypothetical protein
MFRGPELLKTYLQLIGTAMHVVRRVILPISAPIHTLALLNSLHLHLPMEPTLFLLLVSRTMLMRESTIVVVDEAQEALNVVICMFFLNDTFVVVLFDSGTSHSFISTTYVGKHNLPLALLKCQTIVSSLGGDMSARQLCPKVNLKIRGVDFVTNIIVLESKGIDIILGMD